MPKNKSREDAFVEEDDFDEEYGEEEDYETADLADDDEYTRPPHNTNNSLIIVVLVVVLVVLVGTVVYMYTKRNDAVASNTTNNTTTNTGTNNTAANSSTNASSTANNSMTEVDNTPFDPKTATKVPASETPEQYLNRYLKACTDKDWATAFNMLPLGKKTSYATAAAFGSQLASYQITGGSTTVQSSTATEQVLVGAMTTAYGTFAYPWTFVKDNGTWYVKTRGAVTMSQ